MENSFYNTDAFEIQTISKGVFVDNVNGKLFSISTQTIRLTPKALNAYLETWVMNDRMCYEHEEDWYSYLNEKELLKKAWLSKMCELLGLPEDGTTITQIVSEVFGVCHIHKIGGQDDEA